VNEVIPTLTDEKDIPMNGNQPAEFLLSITKVDSGKEMFRCLIFVEASCETA